MERVATLPRPQHTRAHPALVPGVGIEPRRDDSACCDGMERVATRRDAGPQKRSCSARSGDRTHMMSPSRDFKSLASTSFAIRARGHGARRMRQTKIPAGAGISIWRSICTASWRPRSELNRRTRLCRPLHNHSATRPDDVRIVPIDSFLSILSYPATECGGWKSRSPADGASSKRWSGKRDSNSRPQPWQGCALPTELFPH